MHEDFFPANEMPVLFRYKSVRIPDSNVEDEETKESLIDEDQAMQIQ